MTTFKQFIAEGPAKKIPDEDFSQVLQTIQARVKKVGEVQGRQSTVNGRLLWFIGVAMDSDALISNKILSQLVKSTLDDVKGFKFRPDIINSVDLATGKRLVSLCYNVTKK